MSATSIARVHARRVWDSRGRPTVEAEVDLAGGARGRAIAPAGASTGSGEALDLRDGGAVLGGLDVRQAVANVNETIAPALCGLDARDQTAVDRRMAELDGTATMARLGGNATTAVSLAIAQAAAAAAGLPLWRWLRGDDAGPARLPRPEIQIFGGGAHAAGRLDVQDFMVVCPGAETFAQALDWTAAVYHAAGRRLAEDGRRYGLADEGGWWPAFDGNEDALTALVRAIEDAGLQPGTQVAISLDIAATQLRDGDGYRLAREGRRLDAAELAETIAGWTRRYPVAAVEDPLAEDDIEGLAMFRRLAGPEVRVVADDAAVTNATRVATLAEAEAADTLLVKPNQAGTLTAAKAALAAARDAGWQAIVSARSGETEDVAVVHLAVGWQSEGLKVGSFARGERMAKWNEALRIEEELGTPGLLG